MCTSAKREQAKEGIRKGRDRGRVPTHPFGMMQRTHATRDVTNTITISTPTEMPSQNACTKETLERRQAAPNQYRLCGKSKGQRKERSKMSACASFHSPRHCLLAFFGPHNSRLGSHSLLQTWRDRQILFAFSRSLDPLFPLLAPSFLKHLHTDSRLRVQLPHMHLCICTAFDLFVWRDRNNE